MAYQVYITDNINTVELDTEDIDISAVFSVSDLTDISVRKDKIQSITFKGTKTNNQAFGTYYDLGRSSNFDLGNRLLFNYNPLRALTCLVYEDSELIFKGSLRLSEINIGKNGQAEYNTVLTGPVIDLKTVIQDKYLHDLDFTDLRHRYRFSNIQRSWNTSTERFDSVTSAFTSTDFAYGSGYVYPNIDYGYMISGYTGNSVVNNIHFMNYKPAVYVTEYFNRIFNQDELSGYTYEIKGDTGFTEMFNHLIVPDNQEGNTTKINGFVTTYSMSAGTQHVFSTYTDLLPLNVIVHPPADIIGHLMETYSGYTNVLFCKRNFKASAIVSVQISSVMSSISNVINNLGAKVQLVKRNSENNNNGSSNWSAIAEKTFIIVKTGTPITQTVSFDITDVNFVENQQIGVIINVPKAPVIRNGGGFVSLYNISYTASSAQLTIPAEAGQYITADLIPSISGACDSLIPTVPVNVKQIDFLKAMMNQLNLFCYSNNTNSKHLIFERYNDFYVYCQPEYISSVALDWSGKVDYGHGFKQISNISLPKSYLFTYKEDEDYLNKYYKERFNQVYGTYIYDDSFGLIEQKKVELIFSPLIIQAPTGTDRKYPLLYKVDGSEVKKTKTNIKLGYYNGLQDCKDYAIRFYSGSSLVLAFTGNTYPQASNYYLDGEEILNNLHFGNPSEIYFGSTSGYTQAPTSYQNYYSNQIADLTNPDVIYFEADIYLTPLDISNLDLRIPIYIDTGRFGAAYFKINKLDYQGKDQPSKVLLQKIVF